MAETTVVEVEQDVQEEEVKEQLNAKEVEMAKKHGLIEKDEEEPRQDRYDNGKEGTALRSVKDDADHDERLCSYRDCSSGVFAAYRDGGR